MMLIKKRYDEGFVDKLYLVSEVKEGNILNTQTGANLLTINSTSIMTSDSYDLNKQGGKKHGRTI